MGKKATKRSKEKSEGARGGCIKFRQKIVNFDVLATPFNFYLPDGNTEYRTLTGGIAFIFSLALFGTYFFSSLIN